MLNALQQVGLQLRVLLLESLQNPLFYLQLLMFLSVVALAWLLNRQLCRIQWTLPGLRWQTDFTPFYLPLLGLLLGRIVSVALAYQGLRFPLFERLYTLFWVLLLYRLALLVAKKWSPNNQEMIRKRILLPLVLLFIALRLAGQMGAFLSVLNEPLFAIQSTPVSLSLLVFGPLALFAVYAVSQGLRVVLIEDILPQAGLSTSHSYATGTLLSYLLIVVGVLVTLAGLGIEPSTLAVVGSALAVGVGFGLQNTVNNLVSGFLIMFDPLIRVGDQIQVSGERGVIRQIGIRNTMIEASDGTQVVLPNADLASSPVLNLSRSTRLTKVTISLPLPLTANPRHARQTIHAILREHPTIRETPEPEVTLKSIAKELMTFEIAFWVRSTKEIDPVTDEVNLTLWEKLVQPNQDEGSIKREQTDSMKK